MRKAIIIASTIIIFILIILPASLTVGSQSPSQSVTNNSTTSGQGQSSDFNPLIELLNIFLNFGRNDGTTQLTPAPTSSLESPNQPPATNPPTGGHPPTSGFTYYAQCGSEYATLPLPDGCTVCQAGCGPTTVAMISTSYTGDDFNPEKVVEMYKTRGYYLGCNGSGYFNALSLLQSLGLKTTDYIIFSYEPADQVVPDLKNYLDAGWTFFTLANFRENGGGHFFWITDIDDQGNIWAYDPYYGRFQVPPLNENSRYPFPKYRIAFGVKK